MITRNLMRRLERLEGEMLPRTGTGDEMMNLQRRLAKLEALLTDTTGLVPHSAAWMEYWTKELKKFEEGDETGHKG
jgi:hypothetical protein